MRKTHYNPSGTQESFLIPLLAFEINYLLREISGSLLSSGNPHNQFRALDCGCGNQPFRDTIISYGFEYEALDVVQNSFGNVNYVCALDSSAKDFKSAVTKNYSLILATEVLEHVSDWYKAFQNIYSCTAPGGYVLLTAPFFYPLHEEPCDYCRPTIHQFEKVSQAAGFEVHSIKKVGTAVDVIGTVLGATRIRFVNRKNFLDRMISKALVGFQTTVFRFLLRYYDSLTSDGDAIYLSNVVVLRRKMS
jgi:hypothetical protein